MKICYCKRLDILITTDKWRTCHECVTSLPIQRCRTHEILRLFDTMAMEDLVNEYKTRIREKKLKRILE